MSLLATTLLVGALSQAVPAPISDALSKADIAQNGYFVMLKTEASAVRFDALQGMARSEAAFNAAFAQREGLTAFAKSHDLQNVEYFWIANAMLVRGDQSKISILRLDPRVDRIAANPTVSAPLPKAEWTMSLDHLLRAPSAGQTLIGSPQLWAIGIRGQGVVVAGEDTGYAWQHTGLRNSYRGWNGISADHNYNWFDGVVTSISGNGGSCGLNAIAPCDDNGHGTHTMGTMVGDDGANEQVGAAPAAKWIGCRNMDVGDGRPETYLRCMQWMLAPTDLLGNNPDPLLSPDVINNSWGCPPSENCGTNEIALLRASIQTMRNAGILFVAAAGNSGSAGCGSISDPPGMIAETFTVGNGTLSNGMNTGSSRGPITVDGSNRRKPDVTAPGTAIRSTYPPNGYQSLTGTSMASPHTAGAAALLISAFPDLRRNPAAIEQLLKDAAVPVSTTLTCGGIAANVYPNNVAGFGRIDVYAAYQRGLSTGAAGFASGFE